MSEELKAPFAGVTLAEAEEEGTHNIVTKFLSDLRLDVDQVPDCPHRLL